MNDPSTAIDHSENTEPSDVIQPEPGGTVSSAKPAHVPDKFWDGTKGEVRLDSVLKSYAELEKKLGGLTKSIPGTPDEYSITPKDEVVQSTPEINARLHAAGFNQDQAQLVYDLAAEYLLPMISDVASLFEAEHQTDRLVHHFGGEQRWREVSRQIDTWAKSSVAPHVFDALKCTADGVLTLHKMMVSGEPGLLRDGQTADAIVSDQGLKQMMRDPRYWRDQDPNWVEKVRAGFRSLYPDRS